MPQRTARQKRGLPNSTRSALQLFCPRLTTSPKALIPCVPQVFFLASNIMFRAACTSLSSLYPHEQLYTRSAKVISFFSFPHTGQYFVVGALAGSTITRSCLISLAFTSPSTECCTVLPNSPLCQPVRFSSCIYTCSCSNSSCSILFAASRFLLVRFWYALRNFFTACTYCLNHFSVELLVSGTSLFVHFLQ